MGVRSLNHRVLRFSSLASFSSADLVLGHKDFTGSVSGVFGSNANELDRASSIFYDGAYTIITDRFNNRVLLETGLPTTLSENSHRITLGQPNASVGLVNNGPATVACGGVEGLNACSFDGPIDALRVGNKVVVSDFTNNRILIWNTIPAFDQAPADIVLGQPSFTSKIINNGPNTVACGSSSGINPCSLSNPLGLASDGTHLIAADFANSRVLIWNTFPSTHQTPADVVLGQADFISKTPNNGPNTDDCGGVAGVNRCSFQSPFFVKLYQGKLLISDHLNNRILIWNSIPTINQTPADVVIGQENFTTNTVSTLNQPRGICITDTGRLVISDSLNHRLLVFNQIPTTNNPTPDLVLGQESISGILKYAGKETNAGNFNTPYGLNCFQESVFTSDYISSRLIFFPLKPLP